MRDLFSLDRQFEALDLPDADVSILHQIEMPLSYPEMLRRLIDDTKWRQEQVRVYGKVHDQPRLVALYADKGKTYDYSGISLHPLPWTDLLREIKRRVEDCTDATFNAVFLNLYRDHNDSMGFHSDNEKELGKNPIIASVTFGATRTFVMKHKFAKEIPPVKIPLEAGTVLLMKGSTQHNWKHGINKQTRPCGPRVNLTFRTLLS
ncbi:alpha-ketoglutarate-dependent dioxygenase AlkB family protein [Pelagerythrobacter marensis]|uniref:Putative alkylated DNA repair protein n=1 Tax=Pelagerythrobacter marensis TaxID=543877 RepID=A0A0G3X7A7_9SPHN|nr:alpha-ketoglutarate-dependent dioxygenase AlkB [Pelagerythrobacter marensis]AKM06258.1 Putative alkylated DNA repair protein [Pelagerythrobacter marensis]